MRYPIANNRHKVYIVTWSSDIIIFAYINIILISVLFVANKDEIKMFLKKVYFDIIRFFERNI